MLTVRELCKSADRPFTALTSKTYSLQNFPLPDGVLQLKETSSSQQDGMFSDDQTMGAVSTRLAVHA